MATEIKNIVVEEIHLDQINASDLKAIIGSEEGFIGFHIVPIGSDGQRESATAEMIWDGDSGRACIAWDAVAKWTDCESAQDAAERFFGLNEKVMSN